MSTSSERDQALAELAAARVIEPAGFNDSNGNATWRMLGFPSGTQGEQLRELFDRHIKGRADQRGAPP